MGRELDCEDAAWKCISAEGGQGLAGSDGETASSMQGDGVQRGWDRVLLVADGQEPGRWLDHQLYGLRPGKPSRL